MVASKLLLDLRSLLGTSSSGNVVAGVTHNETQIKQEKTLQDNL